MSAAAANRAAQNASEISIILAIPAAECQSSGAPPPINDASPAALSRGKAYSGKANRPAAARHAEGLTIR